MNLETAVRQLINKRGESLAFTSVSVGYGGFDAVVQTDGFKEIFIGIPGAFRVWLQLDGTYKLDVPNEQSIPFEQYTQPKDHWNFEAIKEVPKIKEGDQLTIAGKYKRRTPMEWLKRKPKQLQPYSVKKTT